MIIGTIRKKRFRSITYNELRNRIRTTIRDRIRNRTNNELRNRIGTIRRNKLRGTTISAAPQNNIFREYIFIEVNYKCYR